MGTRPTEGRNLEGRDSKIRERKMRTNFFGTNSLNTARGPGHPNKIPGTSQIPLFETQLRQTFEGGHELFGHHPFAWKTPTPPGGLRTQKVDLRALFSCLKNGQPQGTPIYLDTEQGKQETPTENVLTKPQHPLPPQKKKQKHGSITLVSGTMGARKSPGKANIDKKKVAEKAKDKSKEKTKTKEKKEANGLMKYLTANDSSSSNNSKPPAVGKSDQSLFVTGVQTSSLFFLCIELGPFKAMLGNCLGPFRAIPGNCLGPSQSISGNSGQFGVILGEFGGPKPENKKTVLIKQKERLRIAHLTLGLPILRPLPFATKKHNPINSENFKSANRNEK